MNPHITVTPKLSKEAQEQLDNIQNMLDIANESISRVMPLSYGVTVNESIMDKHTARQVSAKLKLIINKLEESIQILEIDKDGIPF